MKKQAWIAAVLGCLLAASAGAQPAQTTWPAFMPRLLPGVSDSPLTALLPEGGTMVAPDPALPAERARWHGLWHGWACGGRQCDVRVAVEQVGAQRATVAIASANASQGRLAERVQASFDNDSGELHVPMANNTRAVLRLRADGDMELTFWRPATQLVSAGVLTKKPLTPVHTRSIERVPTPWKDGDKVQTLEMVVYRPLGPGPFPTLVFNHGSTGRGNEPEWFKFTWTSPEVASYFTAKGWQVLMPQRRGRGQSDGLYDEGFNPADRTPGYTCEAVHTVAGFERAVADLDAVMAHVRTRPEVDTRHLLIGGVSRGGILSVGYAGMRPGVFEGVINFVGGWIGDGCPTATEVNPALMRRGAAFKGPMLWIYGDRDPFYKLAHSRANFEAFQAAGGQGTFLSFDPLPGRNGHAMHLEPSIWTGPVERYLGALGGR